MTSIRLACTSMSSFCKAGRSIAREARAVDVLMQIAFEIVVTRHGVLLAALLVQADP